MADIAVSSSLEQSLGESLRDRELRVLPRSNFNPTLQQFIKQTCSTFCLWRPWQQRILLCGLTNRCSVHQLELLSSALEPIFHRDFATALTGSYPQSPLRQSVRYGRRLQRLERFEKSRGAVSRPERRGLGRTRSRSRRLLSSASRRSSCTGVKDLSAPYESGRDSVFDQSAAISTSNASDALSQVLTAAGKRRFHPSPQALLSDLPFRSTDSEFEGGYGPLLASSLVSSKYSKSQIRETTASKTDQSLHSRSLALDPITVPLLPLRGKLAHDHLPSYASSSSDSSGPTANTRDYFLFRDCDDALADMRTKVTPTMTKLAMGMYFLTPERGRLAERFKSQLKEIWQYLKSLNDQQQADLLYALIKCSNPSMISYLSYCLFQRLHDCTNIDSLSDVVLLHVFSYLDSLTLMRCAQVCERWHFLSFLSSQWQQRLNELGLSRGIQDLTKTLQEVGGDRYIDWRRAYQEMSTGTMKSAYQKKNLAVNSSAESETSLLHDLQSVNIADLDLRTLLLIAKINGVEDEGLTRTSQPTIKSTADREELLASCHAGTDLKDRNQTAMRISLDNTDGGVTVAKDGGVKGKRRPMGTDFIVSMKSSEIMRHETQRNNTTAMEKRVEKPKLLAIALDIRPPNTADAHPLGIRILSLAGLIVGDDDEDYVFSLVHSPEVLDVRNVRRVEGHLGVVTCGCFDIRRLMTGSMNRTLRVNDIRSGRNIAILEGHKGGVHCVQLFDSKKIITGSWDMSCKVWDVVNFTELRTLTGHRGCVSALKMKGDLLVTGSHDRTLRIWNTTNWLCQRVVIAHDSSINCLDFDGTCCASGSSDRTLRLWDVVSGECLQVFWGHPDSVLCCQMQGKLLASGCASGSIHLWDMSTGESLIQLKQAHIGPINTIVFKDSSFFTGGSDSHIKEWSMVSCSCVKSLQGHTGSVEALQIIDDRLISCSADWTVRIWETHPPILQLGSVYSAQHCETISVKKLVTEINKSPT